MGDAMLFSTWVFLLQRLGRPDWLEIVPGVDLFCRHCRAQRKFRSPWSSSRWRWSPVPRRSGGLNRSLANHDSLVLMKVYGRFARVKALLADAGLLDRAVMMAEATLPGEQCWRQLAEVSDEQPLPYFSTILVNKQWERRETGTTA